MKRTAAYMLLYAIIFSVPLLGCVTGAAIGVSIHKSRIQTEKEKPWKKIDSHYKFVKLEDVNSHSVWARASDGLLYHLDLNCTDETRCNRWSQVGSIPNSAHDTGNHGELPMLKGKNCPVLDPSPVYALEGVVECAVGIYQSVAAFGTYYALLEDGTIWYWTTPASSDTLDYSVISDGFRSSFYGFIAGIILAAIISTAVLISMKAGQHRTEDLI